MKIKRFLAITAALLLGAASAFAVVPNPPGAAPSNIGDIAPIGWQDSASKFQYLQIDASGNLMVTGGGGGGGGGTSSNFGAAFPTAGTAIGVKSGANMVALALGQATMANSVPVAFASDQSALSVSLAANQSVNQTQVNGVTVSVGNGTTDTGTQRVTLSSDSTGQVKLAAGANAIGSVTVTGNPGVSQSGTWNVGGLGTAGSPSGGVVSVQGVASGTAIPISGTVTTTPPSNASTNIAQVNGTTTSVNTGLSDAGTIRVAVGTEAWQDSTITGQSAQTSTINNIIPATAGANGTLTAGYKSGSIQVNSTGTGGTFIFECSNDNTTYTALPVYDTSLLTGTPINAAITASASNKIYYFSVYAAYIRLRIATTITGGSIQAVTNLKQSAFTPFSYTMVQPTAANLNVTIGSGTVTTVTTLTTLANGQTAHSSASTGSPVRIGGRVITTPDTTLVQGDASDVAITTGQQLVDKPFGTSENDWFFVSPASGTITNTTTPVSIAPARAASIHNYITAIDLAADTLGTATEVAVRDVALTCSSQTIASNILVTSTSHGLSVGDTVVASASTVTGLTAGTTYYVLTVPSATNLTFSATPGGSTLAISGTGVTATLNHYLWRQKLQTAGLPTPVTIQFLTPLLGGTAVADEVVTLTASTGGVYFNCRGYQGF